MSYLLTRINAAFDAEIAAGKVIVVIAAPDDEENRSFEQFRTPNVHVIYGSPENVPLRHLQVADTLGVDHIIAVDGDDIFSSMEMARDVMLELDNGRPYVVGSGLPLGMNPFGYSRMALQNAIGDSAEHQLDTGWTHIFDSTPKTSLKSATSNDNRLRFTLDYPQDLEFTRAVIKSLGNRVAVASDHEIIECVQRERHFELNESVDEEYWANFREIRDAQQRAVVKDAE
jgi:glutamate-1-semialdehyde 2,1-aminomutase/spore coat polysaccharide biosynthesis protein SpsF